MTVRDEQTARKLLIRHCQFIANLGPVWTQGPGGNVSVKFAAPNGNEMLIKASGFRLDQVSKDSAVAKVRHEFLNADLKKMRTKKVQRSAEKHYATLLKNHAINTGGYLSPSMETGFHALLRKESVFHFHSLAALLMAHVSKTEPQRWRQWWKSLRSPIRLKLLPFVEPGLELTQSIGKYRNHDVFVLSNHGVIIASDDHKILKKWLVLEKKFCRHWHFSSVVSAYEKSFSQTTLAKILTKSVPFKIYFPDMAVFSHEFQAILQPDARSGNGRQFVLPKNVTDKKLRELWAATILLYEACPKLATLTAKTNKNLNNMLLEKMRQKMQS